MPPDEDELVRRELTPLEVWPDWVRSILHGGVTLAALARAGELRLYHVSAYSWPNGYCTVGWDAELRGKVVSGGTLGSALGKLSES